MIREEPEKKAKENNSASVVEVPSQYELKIKLENGDIVDLMEFQVRIYNKILLIEKAVV